MPLDCEMWESGIFLWLVYGDGAQFFVRKDRFRWSRDATGELVNAGACIDYLNQMAGELARERRCWKC